MKALMRIGLIAVSGAVTCPIGWSADMPTGARMVEVSTPKVQVRPTSLKLLDVAPLDISKLRVESLFVCGGVFEYEEPSPIGLIDLFGSVDSYRRVLSCESVEVVELKPGAHYLAPAQEHADRKVKLPRADAIALRSVLCSDATFDWKSTRQPESRACFRVKFEKDGHVVSLDLFLSDRLVRLVTGQDADSSVSFEFGYPVAAEIIERYFPGALPRG